MIWHLKKIWLQPTDTINEIINNDPEYGVFILTSMTGMLTSLLLLLSEASGRENDHVLYFVMPVAVIGGVAMQFVLLFVGGWLLNLAGRLVGGAGVSFEIRTVIAWSNVPILFGNLLLLLLLLLGSVLTLFGSWQLTMITVVAMQMWSGFILIKGLALVHHISVFRVISSLALFIAIVIAAEMFIGGSMPTLFEWALPGL